MKRREFIKTSSIIGIGSALDLPFVKGEESVSIGFLTEKVTNHMLFPRPHDGASFGISPVGLAWLPCPQAKQYCVEIIDDSKNLVYSRTISADPVHLPDKVLPSGVYQWDVIALDESEREIARRGYQKFTILENAYHLPWIDPKILLDRVPKEHPRILYPHHKLAEIRDTLTTTRKHSWNACKTAADKVLDIGVPVYPNYHKIMDPVARRLEYKEYFKYLRPYVNGALMDLSLAYLMSSEPKYANAAKKILLEIATWPTDDNNVTSLRAEWGDEVGLSISKCAHIAYDWLYDTLTDFEKKCISKMCQERAWQNWRRLQNSNFLTSPGESHEGRLIAYLSDQALVFADETKDAGIWLNYSLKALTTFYPHWAGTDGGWAEGTAYGLWYNTFYIPAFQGLKQLCQFDLWQRPFFKNMRHFFFYCTANHGEIRPFGDSAEDGGPGINTVQGFTQGSDYAKLLGFHAHLFNDPHIGWWVNQIPNYRPGQPGFTSLVFPDSLPSSIPKEIPNSRVFKSIGWVGLHSDISKPEKDTVMIFKASPFGSVSHSHADQNAFSIMKGGTALAIPSGYYGPSYGKPHHLEWTKTTQANNCILVNGQGQVVQSANAKGFIQSFVDKPGFSYVVGDATDAYNGLLESWKRHILFLRPGIFLILDDIKAVKVSTFQWLLHSFEKMDITKNKITSKRKDAILDVYLTATQPIEASQTDQFKVPYNYGIPAKYHKDLPNHWHFMASTTFKSMSIRFAAIMHVYDQTDNTEIEIIDEPGWWAARVKGDFSTIEGWIRLEDNPATAPGFNKATRLLCGKTVNKEEFVCR